MADACGGCSLLGEAYEEQLATKSRVLREALAALGLEGERVGDVVGQRPALGNRTKLLMASGGRPGALRFGFYRRGSMEVVPAEGCPAQHPLALGVLAMVRQALDGQQIAPSNPRGRDGWLHAVGIRVDPPTASTELVLCGRTPRLPGGEALERHLAEIPTIASLHLSVTPARTSYPLEPPFKRVLGRRRIPFSLGGERFLLSPMTFFQTSHAGAELLLEQVHALLPERIASLADLYAGAGIFALLTADRWQRAVAVEANEHAVADLRHHLEARPRPRLKALCGRVEELIDGVLHDEPDVVLLDPPRRGCHPEVLRALLEQPPPVILYVACSVDAFREQAARLVQGGYRATAAAGVDMFPHTPELELVVRFEHGG